MLRRTVVAGVAAVLALVLAACDLDPTFGDGGIVITAVGPGADGGNAVLVDSQGRIVVAGTSADDAAGTDTDFSVVRYLPDGSLDTTFGDDGVVTTDFAAGEFSDRGNAVALDAEGRIVVAGAADRDLSSQASFAAARYMPDGSLDTTFGDGGKVITTIGPHDDEAEAVVVDAEGRILVAGSSRHPVSVDWDVAVVRYLPDGSLDTSFAFGDGIALTRVGTDQDWGRSVAIDAAGRIVVAGTNITWDGNPQGVIMVRYRPNGSLDTSFDGDGKVITDFPNADDEGDAVAIDSAGRLLVAGSSRPTGASRFLVVRCLADGSIDTTFGEGGRKLTDVGPGLDFARSVAIGSNDSVVVAGWNRPGEGEPVPPYGLAVARYLSSGALDTTFSGDGKAITDLDDDPHYDYSSGKAVAIDADGNIVVAGSRDDNVFAVVRYLGAQQE